jgi:hypothetical protein
MQVKLTNISTLELFFNDPFIQDSVLFRVRFREVSLYIKERASLYNICLVQTVGF